SSSFPIGRARSAWSINFSFFATECLRYLDRGLKWFSASPVPLRPRQFPRPHHDGRPDMTAQSISPNLKAVPTQSLAPPSGMHGMMADAAPPNDSMWGPAIVGWAIVVLFFGVIGGWAVTAPLNGAVVAQSVVKVDGNRQSVQHLDGGIVKELRVKEGDHV